VIFRELRREVEPGDLVNLVVGKEFF